jgi:hypothetical protein
MRLDITLPDLTPSCCDNLIYAIVFDKDQRALKDNGFGVLVLQPYTEITHATFGIILTEHAERDRYYYNDLLDANFALPDNPKGECYHVEYWRRPVVGTFARSQDELRETRRIIVANKKLVDATLSLAGESVLANIQSHLSVVYDSENLLLRIMSHLDQNGELVLTTKSVLVTITDSTGTDILSVNSNTFVSNQAGIFYMEVPNIDLPNDRVFVAKAVIIDANNVPHTTVSYVNTWD